MNYLVLKHLHVTCVVLSGTGFALRAWWMWRASPALQHPLARRLPHVIDSLLLGSALWMAWESQQFPFVQSWLTAKFFGLLAYIVLGSLALKRAPDRSARGRYALAAMLAYGYIVSVALSRQPWPF